MRTMSSAAAAALLRSPLPMALLVEMELASGALYLNSGGLDLVIDGNTYYGTKGLGKVDAVRESPAEIAQLKFELSGVPTTSIALALSEPLRGKVARIKTAIFDPDTYAVLQVDLRWQGLLEPMAISDGPQMATLQVMAEHGAIDLIRASTSYYSDSEQRRLYSNDPSLQYMADQAEVRVIWPAASWGRK